MPNSPFGFHCTQRNEADTSHSARERLGYPAMVHSIAQQYCTAIT